MKTRLEDKLNNLENALKVIRQELHASRQKNRDMEKSRQRDREKLKSQDQIIHLLTDELKKKR
ncbi:MAG: hypothetical protein LBL24_06325, partial [Bacteroidales bacterium]|nr:hypothetical protein [Bacteroidales bacterium]